MNQGPDEDKRLTSNDLFGDLVDAKAPGGSEKKTPTPVRPAENRPIKVKVSEPSVFAKPVARAEDLLALVEAFDDGTKGRPEKTDPAGSKASSPGPPAPPPPERRESEQQAEAMSELLQLTRGLPGPAAEQTQPLEPLPEVNLASIAEQAFQSATPLAPQTGETTIPSQQEAWGVGYGPYRLIEKIATGGMAEVFKAKRAGIAGFEKIVAVKRILPHLSYNKEFLEMFVDEAKLVAQLQHPNIVQIFDLGRIGSSYFIAMEYVPGADLRSILRRLKERRLRMPLDLALFIISRVAAGLDHAHQKKDALGRPVKIVHRDVSPQNILISYDGEVKLADFGIAKAATKASITEKGALRGKLMYMSPEQAWGRPIDHRSDIFALGIVLYEIITDQRPFLGDSEMNLLERVRRGTVAPPSSILPEIPVLVEKVLMKTLEKDPADRPRDAGWVHQELEAILQDSSQAPTARDLARFVRILFDRLERGDAAEASREAGPLGMELELRGLERTPAEERFRIASGAMSVERLLKRFGQG